MGLKAFECIDLNIFLPLTYRENCSEQTHIWTRPPCYTVVLQRGCSLRAAMDLKQKPIGGPGAPFLPYLKPSPGSGKSILRGKALRFYLHSVRG